MDSPINKTPTVEIILGVYGKPHLTADCIDSLLRNTTYPRWRLTLLDDCSDSFTHELLAKYAAAHPQIQLLRNETNLGFVGTYNRGMRLSDTDYVVLLNSDVLLSPGWLSKMVHAAESDPTIGMVNPLSNEIANLSVPIAPGSNFLRMNEAMEDCGFGPPFDIVTAIGYCLLVRREALKQLGYLDKVFGHGYCEDTDLHMRFTTNGWRVVAVPNTYVFHLGHGTASKATALKRFNTNYRIFRERWGEQFDRDLQVFQAADPLGPIRKYFQTDPCETGTVPKRRSLLARGLRLLVKRRRELFALAMQPRRAIAAVRRRLTNLSIPRVPNRPQDMPVSPPQNMPTPSPRPHILHAQQDSPSIVFLLGGLCVCGGILRIIELINQMILLGVDARLAVASPTQGVWEDFKGAHFTPMFFNDYEDLVQNLPRCHVVVATLWETAPYVKRLVDSGKADTAVNFLQDFEAWFYPDERTQQQVFSTYPLIPNRIATSDWLRDLLLERSFDTTVIPLSFNALQFYPLDKQRESTPRVVAMARPWTPRRGFDDLIASLRLVHRERPDVEIALFGSDELHKYGKIDFPVVDLGVITDRTELCRCYNESDVFVDASYFQGFGLPALEAMSCEVACVLTNVGGVNQYARDGVNSLMVSPRRPKHLGDAILRLLADDALRKRIGKEGRRTVERLSPEHEVAAWMDYLSEISSTFCKWRRVSSRKRFAA